jgi:peptidoglycan L-alanyl-D-glutamate endopeptidase CwlK
MINSRDLKELTPEAQAKFAEFKVAMDAAEIPFIVTSTWRDQESQNYLYASGRTRPGPILTQRTHSVHQDRRAWDIAILQGKRVIWETKVDVNENQIPDYLEAAKIGASIGLDPGGLWPHFKDWPHFQLKEG